MISVFRESKSRASPRENGASSHLAYQERVRHRGEPLAVIRRVDIWILLILHVARVNSVLRIGVALILEVRAVSLPEEALEICYSAFNNNHCQ